MISRRALGVGMAAMAASATATVLWEDRGARTSQRGSLLIGATGAFDSVYQQWKTDFVNRTGNQIDCDIVEGASQQALTALKRDSLDLAILSRDLSADDDEALTRSYLIARSYALMLVPQALGLGNLSKAQLQAVLRGDVHDWRELGRPSRPVQVITLRLGTRARAYIEATVLDGREITPSAQIANTPQDMVRMVRENPGAIGYVTSNHPGAHQFVAGEKPAAYQGLVSLRIDEVPLSRTSVLSGRYLLTRSFYLVTHGQPSATAQAFVDYARSPAGQAHVAAQGMFEAS